MTLLGKLFRPWDLSSEEAEAAISSNEKPTIKISPDSISSVETNKIAPVRAKSEGSRSKNPLKIKKETDRTRTKVKSRSSETSKLSIGQNYDDSVNTRHFGSETSRHFSYHEPTTPNATSTSLPVTPNCCDPISPSDFDLHFPNCSSGSPCSSNIFLYPSTINELASLSRTELTAMGLLPMESLSSMKTKRQRPKRFHCPHCQVAFSNNGQLKGHVRIHTGERPYECEQEGCGKSFTRNEELTRHRRIHSGLRPFPCSYCGKKFGRKDHLKKHTRTHQRGMYNPGTLIGFGNPFQQPFHPPLGSTSGFQPSTDLISFQSSPYSIQLTPSCFPPPNNSHNYSFPL